MPPEQDADIFQQVVAAYRTLARLRQASLMSILDADGFAATSGLVRLQRVDYGLGVRDADGHCVELVFLERDTDRLAATRAAPAQRQELLVTAAAIRAVRAEKRCGRPGRPPAFDLV